jgi:hypothetical protein
VTVAGTYFININFTNRGLPPAAVGAVPDYVSEWASWQNYAGGCLFVRARNLIVGLCYFYQVHSHYVGSAIFSLTEAAPQYQFLTFRSFSCSNPTPPVSTLQGSVVRSEWPLEDQAADTGSLNYSRIHQTAFGGMSGFNLGGFAFVTGGDVVCHALNCSKVDGHISGGLLMSSKGDGFVARVAYSAFVECYNGLDGVITAFRWYDTLYQVDVSQCNFVNLTSTTYTTATGASTGGAIGVTPRGSCNVDGCIFICNISAVVAIDFVSIGEIEVALTNSVFARERDFATRGDMVLFESGNTFDVYKSGQTTTLALAGYWTGKPTPRLTYTLNFTASAVFTLASVMEKSSVFGFMSGVSAGVIATIFGILSLIAFLFLLYVRRGSQVHYVVLGEFGREDDFEGPAGAGGGALDESYSYTVTSSYTYSGDELD